MDDGHLLIGSLQWSEENYPAHGAKPIMNLMKATDAVGKEIFFDTSPKIHSFVAAVFFG